jgi:hypothetical protein
MDLRNIQSFGPDKKGGFLLVLKDGERLEFFKCPFTTCSLFHAPDTEFCPTTGLTIAAEVEKQKAGQRRAANIDAAQAEAEHRKLVYLVNHLNGWRKSWRIGVSVVGFLLIYFLGAYLAPPDPPWSGFGMLITAMAAFAWLFLWLRAENKRRDLVHRGAEAVRKEILESIELG